MILHAARINFSLQHKTKGKRECFRWCMKWVKFADDITKPKITLCWLMNVDMVRLSLLISLLYSIFKKSVCIWRVIYRFISEWKHYMGFSNIQSKCGKIRTRETPNTDFFYAVFSNVFSYFFHLFFWLWLTHFMLLVSFYTPRKHQKSRGGV